jgi:hypothetical protein
MIFVKINPDAPTRAPEIIRALLFNTKPVDAAAMPEYEFNKEITTGMSAPPIGIVSVIPITAERATSV